MLAVGPSPLVVACALRIWCARHTLGQGIRTIDPNGYVPAIVGSFGGTLASYVQSNLRPDERIVFETKLSLAAILLTLFRTFILLGIPTLLLLLARSGTEFAVTNKRLIIKVGGMRTETLESTLDKVQSISFNQGLFGKWFDYGSVTVSTGGGDMQNKPFLRVSHPRQLREAVAREQDAYKASHIQEQANAIARGISQTLTPHAYGAPAQPIATSMPAPPAQYAPPTAMPAAPVPSQPPVPPAPPTASVNLVSLPPMMAPRVHHAAPTVQGSPASQAPAMQTQVRSMGRLMGCPRCGTAIPVPIGVKPVCPQCNFGA